MSNSPFELFRRYLKPMMIFATILALIAFVALPALQQYQQTVGGMRDTTLASYDGKEIKASRVENFTQKHYQVVQFLRETAQETINRRGMPRTAGFQYNEQTRQITDLGVFSQPSQLATIRTLQFAGEAQKAGFELDDPSLRIWMNRFVDGTMSDGDIGQRWMAFTKNRLGPQHLNMTLRQLLLAQAFQTMADSGLSAGSIPGMGEIPVTTPAQQWENFLKLQQQASIDAYGVLVSDFVDDTDANPSDSEITEVYEEGKNLLPNDQSPDPGFRRPAVAEFEYVAANLNTFIDREVATFTDEQLMAEYEKRIAGGDFTLPEEEDPEEDAVDALGLDEDPTSDEADMSDEADAADATTDEPTETETEPAETETIETEAADAPADAPEMTEEAPAKAEAETTPADDATDTIEEAASEIAEPVTPEPAATESSSVNRDSATTLVAFQDESDEEGDEDATDDESSDKKTTDEESEPVTETTPAVDVPMKDDAEATTDEDADADTEEKPVKVETFDDVRNRIADDLARPIAAQKLDAAVRRADTEMRNYFQLIAIHESNVEFAGATDADAPKRPDLKVLADELGLEYATIGERDTDEIAQEPIGNSVGTGTALNRRGPPFAMTMYGFNNGQQSMQPRAAFLPLTTVDLTAGKTYVTWKTAEVESYAPSLDEARDEVIMAIRTTNARKLAEEEAKRIAAEINANPEKTLTEIVPADRADQIKTGLGPFSWMNMMGFGQMTIGNVPQLDSVGPQFMRAVFTTEINQADVAANSPQRVYYVVKPKSFAPETDELRERFLQRNERFMAQLVTNADNQELRAGFYESLDERTGFKFTEIGEDE